MTRGAVVEITQRAKPCYNYNICRWFLQLKGEKENFVKIDASEKQCNHGVFVNGPKHQWICLYILFGVQSNMAGWVVFLGLFKDF